MKLLAFLFTLSASFSFGQTYWQQEVNYKIDVALNDKDHTLSAIEEFEYINNSPDVLNRIYVHLWPNAYKNSETALAKQQYEGGKTMLKYGPEEEKGNISGLDFKVDGVKVKWEFEEFNIDIAIIELNQPLQPGGGIIVSTPFKVKLPSGKISRLGHIGQSYQITQWYPKPAVYDAEGWHQMPYLNQGEFYSEYGSFDVNITLPENYVVGATGELQTESEIKFLNDRAKKTATNIEKGTDFTEFEITPKKGFPVSSTDSKTIRYTQSNVHDFAWFADKRYNVLKSEVELPNSGRMVTSWAMYTEKEAKLWKKASEYLNDAIYYYSKWNGDYPYNNVTAVDGTISAGGGMEYPNVTVIGRSGNTQQLEIVIVHEVGHNWFYGQLGSNERVHGWMDEGINTLNEVRYMQTKYPDNTAMTDLVRGANFHLEHLNHHDLSDMAYRGFAGIGEDQPIETHSAHFSQINYGVVMYQKTGLIFFYLKDYLGEELFDKSMKAYYSEWEFKHPQPNDMRRSLEKTSGKDLSWLFDDLIQTTNHIDYKLKSVKDKDNMLTVKIKNVGHVDGPIEVNGIKNGKVIETVWIEPGSNKNTVVLKDATADEVRIDANKDIPELNRQNNLWIKDKMLHRFEPLKFELLAGDDEPESTNLFWAPAIAGNHYDKLMTGAIIHNYGIPFNKFKFLITPMYSFGRQMISGIGELSYTMLPKTGLKMSRFGVSIKSFKNDTVFERNKSYYLTVAPYWMAKIGSRKSNGYLSQTIKVQSLYRTDKRNSISIDRVGAYAEYELQINKADHKFNVKLRNEFIMDLDNYDKMARLLLESKYQFRYLRNKMERWIEVRAFVGQQYLRDFNPAKNGYQYSMSIAGQDGTQDLFVDEYYFGRSESSGVWSQQRNENMGGFKSTVSGYGTSAFMMATGNLYFQLPIKPGVFGAFFDVGTFHNGVALNTVYNAGLGVRFGDIFGVYFPIPGLISPQIEDTFKDSNGKIQYSQMIRFTLKFNVFKKPLNISSLLVVG
jgi:hypothetical protein